jgi:Domain of unknown function (DUF4276)
VSRVQVFVEGNSSLRIPLNQFVKQAIQAPRGSVWFQLGKNKDETIKDSLRTLRENPRANILLLVDSDVRNDGKLLESLKRTPTWRNHAPKSVSSERVHWMVHVMESWFITDGVALKAYYKGNFNASALPKRHNVEEILKKDVFRALNRIGKVGYDKAAHAPKILELLFPETVQARAPSCKRFLTALRASIA